MISQQELDEIVHQELKNFNLSIGWIDPDLCDKYEDYESNDDLIRFEISDAMCTRIERDTCLDDKSLDLDCNIVLFVEEHEPYEDWVNFSHEFKLPNIHCLNDVETFTECFKKSVLCSYNEIKLEQLRDKISPPQDLSEEQLEWVHKAYRVDIKLHFKNEGSKVITLV